MKFTNFTVDDQTNSAFNSVVLASFGRSDSGDADGGQKRPATYQIKLIFDSAIFDNSKDVSLQVPNTITTRSATEKPDEIFQPQGGSVEEGQ
jgi:hypothetical protein